MTQENNNDDLSRNNRKNPKGKKLGFFKIFMIVVLMSTLILTGIVGGLVFGAIKDTPKIDVSNIDDLLNQNSFILDQQGNVIEKVLAEENRTAESISNMPDHLQKAFISIEDERFYDHFGIDIRGIAAALVEDIKAGAKVRGASTITQQLARNLYLSNEKKLTRKIREAYIAIQLDRKLSKEQILEAYLNKIYLGQGAYGVKEAAHTYFSKDDLKDLTIAESALIAGITQSPNNLSPYLTVKPQDVPPDSTVVGNIDILGEKYVAIFNEKAVKRQRIILGKMKELEHISESEYQEALNENMIEAIKPGKKKFTDISSYFVDYVKEQVVDDLVEKTKISREEAHRELLTGGLRIYSTVDVNLQRDIEDLYTNFSKVVFGGKRGSSWSSDGYGNILDSYKNILFYKKSNILNENNDLVIENGSYTLSEKGLSINSSKLNIYPKTIDINDFYTIDNNTLVTHGVGSLNFSEDDYYVVDNKELVIRSSFLNKSKDFYRIDERKNLIISSNYFPVDNTGVVQPQSSTVIMDHATGQIKALVGGRNFEGSKILNRALTPRQPGSAIKPLAAFLPALDNGYTAATPIDDVPLPAYSEGKPGPRNSYSGYKGVIPVREAIKISSNAVSVKVVDDIGVKLSKEYLQKLGIIKANGKDSFVTRLENKATNDENLSALGLGGMAKGISPLDMTGAFAAIANEGTYIKPIAYTKVEDRYGNIILENKPSKTKVVSPQTAYVMTDMLQDVVTSGTGGRARVPGVQVAGKTGTTSDYTDAWFVGYTPQYTASVWIGNDSPAIKLPNGSALASGLWSNVMKRVHQNVPAKSFQAPDGIIKQSVCTISGKLPTSLCKGDPRHVVKTEIFAKGTEPKEYCDVHVSVKVDVTTGKLASSNCPDSVIGYKVFMKVNPPYIPSKAGGIIPLDYNYRVPTQYCNHSYIPIKDPDEDDIEDDNDDSTDGISTDESSEGGNKIDNILDNILNPNKDKNNNNQNGNGNGNPEGNNQ
ncbi:Penicillin-binding protein 1A [Gottschalkia acidurici 9a]|uniref:Penicillin-binding protein 1A n=1 Tax=Gottschalkia acidurici (strain ATCC 7906 / DSM 604 / BCRC 14475 / CIP 104303 / KCTC 5404 / NCIMB 10678 / 9a) TaxID=1128398 RepID=K0AXX4_GOTA9|nr:PBP1A family penicillin-binding protein [Gottschalkia acidurici]AFS78049.1 Penicillin-binding protein 1A [Gottschalkia acidurici 9a]